MDKIGVVIPCYNHQDFLREAIESVQWQTSTVFDVVVVDDGSRPPVCPGIFDSSVNVEGLVNTGLPFVHFIAHLENRGVSAARNTGIRYLIGEGCTHILPLDADDVLERTMIEEGLKILEQGYDIAYPDCTYFGQMRGPCHFPVRTSQHELLREMMRDNEMVNSCLFRKEVFEAIRQRNGEGYDTALKDWGWEDWLFWLEALLLGFKAKGIHKSLLRYRIKGDSRVLMSNEKGGLCWKHFQRKLKELYGIELEDRHDSSPAEGSLLGGVRRPARRRGESKLSIR